MNIIWWYHILSQKQTIPWCSHKRSCQQNWLLKIQISTVVVPQNQNSEYVRLHIVDLHINQVDIDQFIEYPKTWMLLFPLQNCGPAVHFFRSIHFGGGHLRNRKHGVWVCLKIGYPIPSNCLSSLFQYVPISSWQFLDYTPCSDIFSKPTQIHPNTSKLSPPHRERASSHPHVATAFLAKGRFYGRFYGRGWWTTKLGWSDGEYWKWNKMK